jgi:predicted glutamine amidotransferase
MTASCTPPSVTVVVSGGASAALQTTLQTNLPAILEIKAQAVLATDALTNLTSSAGAVVTAFTAEAGCAVKYGADFVANVQASAQASINVKASFTATASVSTSAGTG